MVHKNSPNQRNMDWAPMEGHSGWDGMKIPMMENVYKWHQVI